MSNFTKEEIIERIKKLSRMTIERGCTKEEADVALSKIKALMLEYDISENDVGMDCGEGGPSGLDCKESIMDVPHLPNGTLDYFLRMATCIGKTFNTKVLYSPALRNIFVNRNRRLHILGRPQDIELVKYFIDSVFANFNISLDKYKKELKSVEMKKKKEFKKMTINKIMEIDNVSELEANLIYKRESVFEMSFKEKMNKFRSDSVFSFSVGFMEWIKDRFDDMKKAREEQAKASGFMLVPVGFFDEKMKGVKEKKSSFDMSRLNQGLADGRAAALNCPIMEGVKHD